MDVDVAPAVDTVVGPTTLEDIHSAFVTFWSEHPDTPDTVRIEIELAATEIAANIIEYSASGRPVRVQMHLEMRGDEIRTIFHDDGNAAAVDLNLVRMPGLLAEGGRGLAIAISVLDALCYRRGENLNTWTLTRSLRR